MQKTKLEIITSTSYGNHWDAFMLIKNGDSFMIGMLSIPPFILSKTASVLTKYEFVKSVDVC